MKMRRADDINTFLYICVYVNHLKNIITINYIWIVRDDMTVVIL